MLGSVIHASRSAGTLTSIDVKDIVRSMQCNNGKLGAGQAFAMACASPRIDPGQSGMSRTRGRRPQNALDGPVSSARGRC